MDLQTLKAVRASYKGKLTRLQKYIEKLQQETSITIINDIRVRMQELPNILRQFDEIQMEIETLDPENTVQNEQEREQFENKYFEIKAAMDAKISGPIVSTSNTSFAPDERFYSTRVSESTYKKPNVKLPQLELPKFDGDMRQWPAFKNIFNASVDKTDLPMVNKLQYLKTALTGEAAGLIASLLITDENYVKAIDILTQRYENKTLIVNFHLKAITSVSLISKHNLKDFLVILQQSLDSLRAINLPVDGWDVLLVFLITQKLDNSLRAAWEINRKENTFPTLKELLEFLNLRRTAFELINDYKPIIRNTHVSTISNTKVSCSMCQKDHSLHRCPIYIELAVAKRIEFIKSKALCFNCLQPYYENHKCSKYPCQTCRRKHHTSIHMDSPNTTKQQQCVQSGTSAAAVLISQNNQHQTLLSTAIIQIQDGAGKWLNARALLDTGSEVNLITRRLSTMLQLGYNYNTCTIQGVGNSHNQTQVSITTNISSRHNDYNTKLTFFVMDYITVPLPHTYIDTQSWAIPNKQLHTLADPTFYKPGPIDVLIGAELFYNILQSGHIRLGPNSPHLIETTLGWIISGPIGINTNIPQCEQHNNPLVSMHVSVQNTDALLRSFWEQEETPTKRLLSPEDKYCEDLYTSTTTQDNQGRYTVNLPIQQHKLQDLGDSFKTAYRYQLQLESSFLKNPNKYIQYKSFIHEFIQLGHAEYIDNFSHTDPQAYYLPHFAIIKPESRTTKLRTVFNASSKTTTGLSLNDILYEGPNIYNDLLDIILRFRLHRFVFSCDIVKMFRGIFINPEQRCLQRILWRDTTTEPLKCLELTTVTYGTKSAPYLACRTMLDLAEKYSDTYPLASKCIKLNGYMDDYLSGAQSKEECIQLCSELINLLAKAGFSLHKWTSNNPHILKNILNANTDTQSSTTSSIQENYTFTPTETVKTLGLIWSHTLDTLQISLPTLANQTHTKRHILSQISQIFDPIGILAPTTIHAKLLMQAIWKENTDWDSTISPELDAIWLHYINQLHYLQEMQIPRWYFTDIPNNIYLIGFCDASSKAYGACLYLKATYNNKQSTCTLVMAKSKVTPCRRQQSIPRLELCSAVLLCKITHRFLNTISGQLTIKDIYLFSDSNIVLSWIQSPYKNKHDTYITHRLMQIIDATKSDYWNYIHTKQNPADLITRGVMPKDLNSCSLWWQGPSWIMNDQHSWPIFSTPTPTVEDPTQDQKEKVVAVTTNTLSPNYTYFYELFCKQSNFTKLVRITAFMLRFIHNLKNKTHKLTSHLSLAEIEKAHNFIIKTTQEHSFHKEIIELQSTCKTPSCTQHSHTSNKNSFTFKSSPIRKLNPFLDKNKLIRIGGRIQHSDIPYNQAHPIILPAKDHITTLIVQNYHLRLLHSGIQNTLYNIRLQYWPINGRNEVKKVIHSCVRCIRFRAQACGQQMSSLPPARVTLKRAFCHVGIDFSGAIAMRTSNLRNCKYLKGYICLFVCLATRAIHLELVNNLSSEAFICALKRFISRRGIPNCLYTDNATNFKGSKTELHELYKMFKADNTYSQIINFCTSHCIEYRFTIPLASHMGGIYEAGIKSVKTLLKRHLCTTKLTYELLYTLLVQIEGILNSRPLCPITDIPNDITCLTPSHFIIGTPITDLPEPNLLDYNETRLNSYQRVILIKQKFWKQFYSSYLSELQTRNKWLKPEKNLRIGDLVIVKDEATPPTCWPLGRIISININKTDNLVRSVEILTSKGQYTRPIHKLILLPNEEKTS